MKNRVPSAPWPVQKVDRCFGVPALSAESSDVPPVLLGRCACSFDHRRIEAGINTSLNKPRTLIGVQRLKDVSNEFGSALSQALEFVQVKKHAADCCATHPFTQLEQFARNNRYGLSRLKTCHRDGPGPGRKPPPRIPQPAGNRRATHRVASPISTSPPSATAAASRSLSETFKPPDIAD